MNITVNQIAKVFYDVDPAGLACFNCPEDEYIHEAKMMFECLQKHHDEKDLSKIIWEIFDHQFNGVIMYNELKMKKCSNMILGLIKNNV